jgi:choline dehydrogenase-like flavoprotein
MTAPIGPALAEAIARTDPARLEDRRGFDAIVVGAGASGGMAALQLTGAGLEVLVLDAGWRTSLWEAPLRHTTAALVKSVADPRLQTLLPARAVSYGTRALKLLGRIHQPVQARCFAWPLAPDSFVCDRDRPYAVAEGEFHWFRTEQIGGKMIVPGHGRQYYRLGPRDLHPEDGLSPPWPLELGELTPWYDYVEDLLGVSGGPDRDVPPHRQTRPSPAERQAMTKICERWPGVRPMIGRSAPPLDALELAAATERLWCRRGAVVGEVLIADGGAVRGVSFVDRQTRTRREVRAPIVFLCASALESTRILLASRPPAGPIGERSGALGRYLMDHVILSGEGVGGPLAGEPVENTPGRCVHLPRLDLRDGAADATRETRGHGAQMYRWSIGRGRSYFNCVSFAEMLPRPENRVVLDRERCDAFGLPTLRIACGLSEAERRCGQDQAKVVRELGELFGVRFSRLLAGPAVPGTAIHECGTARMGEDPRCSVLDPYNQCWDARGLYVTDGACFPSQGAQNPTLTILALTARTCARATGAEPAWRRAWADAAPTAAQP